MEHNKLHFSASTEESIVVYKPVTNERNTTLISLGAVYKCIINAGRTGLIESRI